MSEIYNGTFLLGNTSATTLSAGPGIKITTDEPGVIKVSNDETVLFENQTATTASMILSEPLTNFEYFEIYGHWDYNMVQCIRAYNKVYTNSARGYANAFSLAGYGVGNIATGNTDFFFCGTDYSANDTTITVRKCMRQNLQQNLYSNTDGLYVDKIVGVNRISGGN